MADAPASAPAPNALRIKALDLANSHMAGSVIAHDEVVKRATAYHAFLSGGAAPAAKPATPPATGAQGGTGKPATPPAGKPATPPAGGKPATPPAGGKPAARPATPPAGGKPAAKPGAAANKPPAQNAAGAPSPEGLGMEDVSKALQKVLNKTVDPSTSPAEQLAARDVGKKEAYKILKEVASCGSLKDVKPAQYKAVIDACEAAANAPVEAGDDDFGAPTGGVPISADDNAVDTDPPEQTGAGENAEDV